MGARTVTSVARSLVVTLMACLLVSVPGAGTASAADLSRFDAGMIISDAVFYDASTMSTSQVQTFLDSKGASCNPPTGYTCLKSFRQTTTSRAATDRCKAYVGASSETAARIITKVAAACGINPQVILVTLQKEQGLVTASTGRTAAVYRKAMGFGCPDTAACDSKYYGFFNQVYSAASQFKNYAANPTRYGHIAGRTNAVRYHPDAECGSSSVYIRNQATAGLYNYTPYQPNRAALAAGFGTGDDCSSYGNRNFWNYFTDWFGSTTQREPIGRLDSASSPSAGTIRVRGWALDLDTEDPISVHVYVDGRAVRSVKAQLSRSDIAAAYGRGALHGFDTTVSASNGSHRVCVFAIDSSGGRNPSIGCSTVSVANASPRGKVDAVGAKDGHVTVRGWTFDPDTDDPIAVHVYVDGRMAGALTADTPRADVARAYGVGPNHGFSGSIAASAGRHRVCLYAINAPKGGNKSLGCSYSTVVNAAPRGTVDSVSASGVGSASARGWAIDTDTGTPVTVQVTVDGAIVQTLVADGLRADVGSRYGLDGLHGFSTSFTAEPGDRLVCVNALDTWTGASKRIGCTTRTVNGRPFGHVDSVTAGATAIHASGWAIDPNTTAAIAVHARVTRRADGASRTFKVTADLSRPDVDREHGMGPNHGFAVTATAAAFTGSAGATYVPGTYSVCLYGIDVPGGANTLLGCRSAEVP